MEPENVELQQLTKIPEVYTYRDLVQFENQNTYSSIGKMIQSTKPTSAKYSFGSATREKQERIFQNKEMSKTQFLGKSKSEC